MEPNRFEYNATLRILRAADQGRYAVIAATAYTLEQVIGFVKAAERRKSPLIIQFLPWAIAHSNGILIHAAAQALPFDSIMVGLPYHFWEGHLAKTKELAAYCHTHGKAAVVEPWRSEEALGRMWDTLNPFGHMTTPQEAWEFVDAGVDLLVLTGFQPLAGLTPRGQPLDDRNVELIRRWIDTMPDRHDLNEGVLQSITAGARKIDINYMLLEQRADRLPLTQVVNEAIEAAAEALAGEMDFVGSTGRA